MPDYANAKIYSIRSHLTGEMYIGGTTQSLPKRMYQHKYMHSGCTSALIINCGDSYIELLELFPCDNKMQLGKREGELIRSMDCVNKRVAGRSAKEYYQDNKSYVKEQCKLYYQANKEKISNSAKARNPPMICECGRKILTMGLKQHLKSKLHDRLIKSQTESQSN